MFDGEALVGPRVKEARPWQPLVREPVDPIPSRAILLAAPRQHAHLEHHDVVPERCQGVDVGWYCMIGKEACHHLPQPLSLAGDRGLPSINGASRSSGLVTVRIVVLATRV